MASAPPDAWCLCASWVARDAPGALLRLLLGWVPGLFLLTQHFCGASGLPLTIAVWVKQCLCPGAWTSSVAINFTAVFTGPCLSLSRVARPFCIALGDSIACNELVAGCDVVSGNVAQTAHVPIPQSGGCGTGPALRQLTVEPPCKSPLPTALSTNRRI